MSNSHFNDSSAYAGDNGLGRGGMRNFGCNRLSDASTCFGGFRSLADDPPKPWHRWVWFLGTTGLPVGLH